MNAVVHLTEYRFKETIAVLRHLLRLALRGDVLGLAICYRTPDGEDKFAFTGEYRTDAAAGLKAANRISWKMNQAVDAREGLLL